MFNNSLLHLITVLPEDKIQHLNLDKDLSLVYSLFGFHYLPYFNLAGALFISPAVPGILGI